MVTLSEQSKVPENMIPLHPGSRVYIAKDDILSIFSNKPALYTVRLAELIFGTDALQYSCLPGDIHSDMEPLDEVVLSSIISNLDKS